MDLIYPTVKDIQDQNLKGGTEKWRRKSCLRGRQRGSRGARQSVLRAIPTRGRARQSELRATVVASPEAREARIGGK